MTANYVLQTVLFMFQITHQAITNQFQVQPSTSTA
jgi:hypothetical protein